MENEKLLEKISQNAQKRALDFGLEKFKEKLLQIIS
jgi:hypothetical protein